MTGFPEYDLEQMLFRPKRKRERELLGPTCHEIKSRGIDRPRRPCARCGKKFQPTLQRRLLCASCFGDDDMNANGALPDSPFTL